MKAVPTSSWHVRSNKISTALRDGLPRFREPKSLRPMKNMRALAATMAEVRPPDTQAFDWRNRNAVPPARDQGSCSTCSSFAIATTIETLHFIKTGKTVSLAPGFIHSCLMGLPCEQGADLMDSVDAVCAHGAAYGFTGDYPFPIDQCNIRVLYAVKQRVPLLSANEAMNAVLNTGPFVASMLIDPAFIRLPKAAIYRLKDRDSARLHSVSVIGYDQSNECWIIANSFGPRWGDGGFAKVSFGDDAPMGGRCGWQLLL